MKKLILLILLLTGCGKNTVPQKTQIDAVIEQAKETIQNAPSPIECEDSAFIDFCNILKMHNIQLINKLQDKDGTIQVMSQIIDSLEKKPTTIIDKSRNKTKIKKSYNEDIKMKNSLLIKDSQIDSLNINNLALKGKIKDLEKEITKNKNSSTGENSPNTVKSGNTTKKASWYLWLIVFIAGGFTSLGIRSAITKTI